MKNRRTQSLPMVFFAICVGSVACTKTAATLTITSTEVIIQSEQTITPELSTYIEVTHTSIPTAGLIALMTPTSSPSMTTTPTSVPSATAMPTATNTVIPSSTPTYAVLRGKVLQQSNCRYGPGAAYLYKYGLYPGNNIEITGRNETGTWIVIQAIGGTNPCWVKASLLEVKGAVMSLAPASLTLPQSPFYGPLTGVSAQRNGDEVTISWHPLVLRAGDDSLQYPYLVEAWICQDEEQIFTPVGSWETFVTVKDESGCDEPSYARVYGVEKHGYTNWATVPWPAP